MLKTLTYPECTRCPNKTELTLVVDTESEEHAELFNVQWEWWKMMESEFKENRSYTCWGFADYISFLWMSPQPPSASGRESIRKTVLAAFDIYWMVTMKLTCRFKFSTRSWDKKIYTVHISHKCFCHTNTIPAHHLPSQMSWDKGRMWRRLHEEKNRIQLHLYNTVFRGWTAVSVFRHNTH